MMSVSTISSAGNAGAYYSSGDNILFVGELITEWSGEIAKEMGLSGHVDIPTFQNLLEGKLPGNVSMGEKHRPGIDMTFSAPKSVSILALEGGDTRLIEAFRDSVRETIPRIESFISARITKDGKTDIQTTGKGLFASFVHDTSRNLDPQLHVHVIGMNITEEGGKYRALSSSTKGKQGFMDMIYEHHTLFGKMQRDCFQEKVEALGYSIRHTQKGLWEIEGVSQSAIDALSSRRHEIVQAVGDTASLKSRDVATLDTRKEKVTPDKTQLLNIWGEKITQSGFDSRAFIDKAKNNAVTFPPVYTDNKEEHEIYSEAISYLSDRKNTFSYNDLMVTLTAFSDNTLSPERAQAIIEQRIASSSLVPVNDKGNEFISGSRLADEKALVSISKTLASGHTTSQTDPRIHILNTGSTLQSVRDAADTIARSGRGIDDNILFISPTAARRDQVFSYYASDKKATFRDVREEGFTLAPGSTVIVDNAERMTTETALKILNLAAVSDSKVVFFSTQARSAPSGTLKLLRDGGVKTTDSPQRKTVINIDVNSIADRTERMQTLANDYASLKKEGKDPVVVSLNPKEHKSLNIALRDALTQSGELSATNKTEIEMRSPLYLTVKDKGRAVSYQPGLVIEDRTSKHKVVYTVESVHEDTRKLRLRDEEGNLSVVKAKDLSSDDIRVFRSEKAEIAAGETLKITAAISDQRLKAKDSVTVSKIENGVIYAVNERTAAEVRLYTNEPVYAKYGYISGAGEQNRQTGAVLIPLNKADINASNINAAHMSGDSVSIYTASDSHLVSDKITKINEKTTLTDIVIRQSGATHADDGAVRLNESRLTPEDLAVTQAIEGLKDVSVSRLDLLHTAVANNPKLHIQDIEALIDKKVTDGALIALPDTRGEDILVPRAVIEQESSILRMIHEGKGDVQPLLLRVSESAIKGLTDAQAGAVKDILASSDRFHLVQGYAGVGKTTKLRALTDIMNTALNREYQIHGLAPTHRAVGEMKGAGLEAQTVRSFILDTRKQQSELQQIDFSDRLFVLDEASMTGNRDMADAMKMIAEHGGRAILMGDKDQFLPVESGSPFALVQKRSDINISEMKDIVRQTNPVLKESIYQVIAGNTAKSLATLAGMNSEAIPRQDKYQGNNDLNHSALVATGSPENTIDAIAFEYASRTEKAQEDTLVITGTNNVRREINSRIQDIFLHDGKFDGKAMQTVDTLQRRSLSTSDLIQSDKWKKGDVVVNNSRYFTVAAVGDDHVVVKDNDTQKAERWLLTQLQSEKLEVFSPISTSFYEGDRVVMRKTDLDNNKISNAVYQVETISPDGNMRLKGETGTVNINPTERLEDRHIDLGYAVTSTGAQGASYRYSVACLGVSGAEASMTDQRAYYISVSRAKENALVFTESVEKLGKMIASKHDKATGHDILDDVTTLKKADYLMSFTHAISDLSGGRVFSRQHGLHPESSEIRLLAAGKGRPLRAVVGTLDENGRNAGILIYPVDKNHPERVLSAQDGSLVSAERYFGVVQLVKGGELLVAEDFGSALTLASENADKSVVFSVNGAEVTSSVMFATGNKVTGDIDGSSLRDMLPPEQPLEALPPLSVPEPPSQTETTPYAGLSDMLPPEQSPETLPPPQTDTAPYAGLTAPEAEAEPEYALPDLPEPVTEKEAEYHQIPDIPVNYKDRGTPSFNERSELIIEKEFDALVHGLNKEKDI